MSAVAAFARCLRLALAAGESDGRLAIGHLLFGPRRYCILRAAPECRI